MAKFNLARDPRLYQPAPKMPNYRRCLGLDLGSSCGVAISDFEPGKPIRQIDMILGQWDLSVGPHDTGPLRHIRLKQFLAIAAPDLVMFEDVKNTPPMAELAAAGRTSVHAIIARAATAAELLGAFKCTVVTWCEEHGIPAHGLSIQHIKQHATKKGNANKGEIIAACNAKFGTDFSTEEEIFRREGFDNMADAAFACDMGLQLYSDGL